MQNGKVRLKAKLQISFSYRKFCNTKLRKKKAGFPDFLSNLYKELQEVF
jgi:hypothetical protein